MHQQGGTCKNSFVYLRVTCTSTTSTTTSAPQGSSSFPSSVAVTNSIKDDLGLSVPAPIPLLKYGRSPVDKGFLHPERLDEELRREIEFVKKHELLKSEERDRIFALTLNDKQYEEEGQKIECGCCYGDAAFEDMVQCLEGHLFCASCLMNYAKEAAFGQGKAALVCMSDGCDGTFPMSQLRKALPTNILEKYEDSCTRRISVFGPNGRFCCDALLVILPQYCHRKTKFSNVRILLVQKKLVATAKRNGPNILAWNAVKLKSQLRKTSGSLMKKRWQWQKYGNAPSVDASLQSQMAATKWLVDVEQPCVMFVASQILGTITSVSTPRILESHAPNVQVVLSGLILQRMITVLSRS